MNEGCNATHGESSSREPDEYDLIIVTPVTVTDEDTHREYPSICLCQTQEDAVPRKRAGKFPSRLPRSVMPSMILPSLDVPEPIPVQ